MIAFLGALPIGNAVRVVLAPSAAAIKTRVLRKTTNNISGATDATASIVYENNGSYFVDSTGLTNGTEYFYGAYEWINGAWAAAGSAAGITPNATANFQGPDPLSLLCDRLDEGLQAEIVEQAAASSTPALTHANNRIPVFSAPPQEDNVQWPCVTVHLRSDATSGRGLGEGIANDFLDTDSGDWTSLEGALFRNDLEIICWSLNPDERIALRKAVKKVLLGNLPVFDDAGMVNIDLSAGDTEDFESFSAPVYQTTFTMSCLAPGAVDSSVAPITSVTMTAQAA